MEGLVQDLILLFRLTQLYPGVMVKVTISPIEQRALVLEAFQGQPDMTLVSGVTNADEAKSFMHALARRISSRAHSFKTWNDKENQYVSCVIHAMPNTLGLNCQRMDTERVQEKIKKRKNTR